MVHRHVKGCSASLMVRDMQTEAAGRHYGTSRLSG